jgi:uncharacterized protein (TIGR04255 family)
MLGDGMKAPHALERPPLLEAIFEVRVTAADPAAAELLPGVLFGRLPEMFKTSEAMPAASLPAEVRRGIPDLRYQPLHRLTGEGSGVVIGDSAFGYFRLPPYPGWPKYKEDLLRVLEVLNGSGLIGPVLRYSMKVVNILNAPPGKQLELIAAELRMRGQKIPETGFSLKTEYHDREFVQVVQVATNARAASGDAKWSGLHVSIDCVSKRVPFGPFWRNAEANADTAHDRVKEMFFSVLRPETIESLGPLEPE